MATGGLPRSESQYADIIIRGNYPELDETTYAARAGEQHSNSLNAFASANTVTNMATNVADNMQGLTADAADAQFTQRVSNFTAQGVTFENRSLSTALAGQNILNAKTEQNAAVAGFEMAWEEAKVALVASGADQATLDQTYQTLVQEFQAQSDAAAANFTAADSDLKAQIVAGSEPSVPASMPSGAPGAGGSSLELPPELMSQMQGMLGQGMGMAQSLPQSLQGAVTPLGEQGQQALDKVLQAAQGGSGNVNVTPEMLDEMLAGQDTESGGSGGASDAPEAPSPEGFQGENTDNKPEEPKAEDTEPEDEGDDEPAGEDTEASAPSPAASPVTAVAAPPESAKIPETVLSADSLAELFG